jgi:hypothetical protein
MLADINRLVVASLTYIVSHTLLSIDWTTPLISIMRSFSRLSVATSLASYASKISCAVNFKTSIGAVVDASMFVFLAVFVFLSVFLEPL